MNKNLIKFFIYMLVLTLPFALLAKGGDGKTQLKKTNGSPSYTRFNINNVSTYIYNNGSSDIQPNGNSGFIFPKYSNKAPFFQSGFLWGGKVDGQIRVGGSVYRQGTRPGRVISPGVAASESDPDVRIYRVRRDVPGNVDAAKLLNKVKPEARDEGITTAEVVAQYQLDWNEWPASQGAPYEDIDKNGSYDPTKDIPGFVGADQTVWFVANDLDAGTTDFMYGTLPMGIEEQVTIWGYNKAGDLGNMLFRKYLIINKSAQQKAFTDMYVSMWSDPDNGDAGDDYVACDTTLSLFYVYNAKASDATYGTNPPAAGFDFFQGPRIKTNATTDTAIFKGKKWVGYKNLPMTAFYYFAQGATADYSDPQQGISAGAQQFYNLFQGLVGRTGQPFPVPTQVTPRPAATTRYPLSGDPVAGTGYLDGIINVASDRRMGAASGTFTLAYGDTQEVVVAELAAGARSGVSNIRAITLLKAADKEAQKAFNNFFPKPTPFLNPVVEVVNLDRQVVLNWGADVASANATEKYADEFYKFQGYEVFQLATEGSSLEDPSTVRIATYDIIDGTTSIIGQDIDPVSSDVISKVYHYGKDTGLQRQIILNKNYITNENLNNGSKYYYAVRAYANTDSTFIEQKAITTTLDVLTAIPQTPDPGVKLTSKAGDKINATHSKGSSDGLAFAIVVDPSKVTGKTYKVSFKKDSQGDTYWQLHDGTKVVLDNQYNQVDNGDYYIVDGLMVKVTGPTDLGVKQSDSYTDTDKKLWGWDFAGTRRFTWANGDPGGNFGLESFGNTEALGGHGTLGWASPRGWFVDGVMVVGPTELKNVELRLAKVTTATIDFAPTIDKNDVNVSYGYRYMRLANSAAAKPEFTPFIISKLGSYSFQIFEKNVPLSAWNIDDPAAPKRLAVGFLENNVTAGLVDGVYWPGSNARITDNGLGTREWLYVFDEAYTTTVNDVNTGQLIAAGNKTLAARIMYTAMWNRRGDAPFSPGTTGEDKFYIYPNKPNSVADEFTFTAPTAAFSAEQAKLDVDKVNVFPNPYYGVNSQEINKYQRFVTFNHLPKLATIRIFNLAGQLVRTIDKNSDSQFQRWDLKNFDNLPVASGMYVVQVDMPSQSVKKTLKLIVIQETQVLDKF